MQLFGLVSPQCRVPSCSFGWGKPPPQVVTSALLRFGSPSTDAPEGGRASSQLPSVTAMRSAGASGARALLGLPRPGEGPRLPLRSWAPRQLRHGFYLPGSRHQVLLATGGAPARAFPAKTSRPVTRGSPKRDPRQPPRPLHLCPRARAPPPARGLACRTSFKPFPVWEEPERVDQSSTCIVRSCPIGAREGV